MNKRNAQKIAEYITNEQLVEMTLRNSLITREQVRQNEDLQPMYNARYLGGYDVRAIYETERTKLLRQGAESERLLQQCRAVMIEARKFVDGSRDNIPHGYKSDTWEEDAERSIYNINATLNAIPPDLNLQQP